MQPSFDEVRQSVFRCAAPHGREWKLRHLTYPRPGKAAAERQNYSPDRQKEVGCRRRGERSRFLIAGAMCEAMCEAMSRGDVARRLTPAAGFDKKSGHRGRRDEERLGWHHGFGGAIDEGSGNARARSLLTGSSHGVDTWGPGNVVGIRHIRGIAPQGAAREESAKRGCDGDRGATGAAVRSGSGVEIGAGARA